MVKCLFIFKDSNRICEIEKGASLEKVRKVFRINFKFYGNVIFQQWHSSFNEWVESNEISYCANTAMKLRVVPVEIKENLLSTNCAVFCCDMQERFRSAIKYFSEISEVGKRLLEASKILDVPLIVTEQYPKGLLKTIAELDISHAKLVVEKTRFSMLEKEIEDFLCNHPNITSVILFGVEAHVCIQQTTLDLLSRGLQVFIIADATSSRSLTDRHMAFKRLGASGATVTTYESVLFQMIRDKTHPKFKEVQNLIKVLPPDTGLLPKSSM